MESSVWVAPKPLSTKQTNKNKKILACFLGKLAPLLDTKSNALCIINNEGLNALCLRREITSLIMLLAKLSM